MGSKIIFTPDQLNWWRERLNGSKRVSKYVDEFVKTFGGVKYSITSYLVILRREGIITEEKQPQLRFTDEQRSFIGNNIIDYIEDGYFDRRKLIADFKEKFGLEISYGAIKSALHTLNTSLSKCGSKSSRFIEAYKRGYVQKQDALPIGSEIIKDDRVYIKINNIMTKGNADRLRKNFRLKSHILYEQYNNCKVNDDEVVIHLDNDYRNFSKDNLVKMNEKLFIRFKNNNFHKLDPSLKLLAIKQCELMAAIKERSKQ